ncbi:MAG: hypothetical protein AAF327_25185 [Cyanobacteria bacterium P01_A01_bin.37]
MKQEVNVICQVTFFEPEGDRLLRPLAHASASNKLLGMIKLKTQQSGEDVPLLI